MPTSVHINERLALRVQLHTGSLNLSEIETLIGLYRANPRLFAYDVVQILDETTVFDFDLNAIPAIKGEFRELVQGAGLPLILRSAWVCPNPKAWSVLEAWLHERHSLDGLHSETRLVATLDEADDLFEPDEIGAIQRMTDFRHWFST